MGIVVHAARPVRGLHEARLGRVAFEGTRQELDTAVTLEERIAVRSACPQRWNQTRRVKAGVRSAPRNQPSSRREWRSMMVAR